MTQDNKRGFLAAAMPLLLIVSLMAVGPVEASHGSGVTAVGVAAGTFHTCVLTSGGDVDCYGAGESGMSGGPTHYGQSADW